MMKRLLLPLLLFTLATSGNALKLIVWDSEMQTKLGAGESSGNKFGLQLVKDYSGPVKVIFSQSTDEKARNVFNGLQSSYDGILKNGQLSLLSDSEDKSGSFSLQMARSNTMQSNSTNSLPLGKFLQQFKLSLVVQPTSQTSTPADQQLFSHVLHTPDTKTK